MNKYFTAVIFSLTIIFSSHVNAKPTFYGNSDTEQKSIVEKDKLFIALELMKDEPKEGLDMLKELAETGDRDAQYVLGTFYYDGLGNGEYIEVNAIKAVQWLKLAAKEDDRDIGQRGGVNAQNEALFYLGNIYHNLVMGDGIVQDFEEAVKWFKIAANKGHKESQFNLGYMYYKGGYKGILGKKGITQDKQEAVTWWSLCAEQGYVKCQYMIGLTYYKAVAADGIVQDLHKAAKWFDMAAKQGDKHAQFNLGVMYYRGKGVPKDLLMAHQLFSLAAAQGDKEARSYKNKVAEILMKDRMKKDYSLVQD